MKVKSKKLGKEQTKMPQHSPKGINTNEGGIATDTEEHACGPWPGSSASKGGILPCLFCPWLPMRLLKPRSAGIKVLQRVVIDTRQKKFLTVTWHSGHFSTLISAPHPSISGTQVLTVPQHHQEPTQFSTYLSWMHMHSTWPRMFLCLCYPAKL